MNPHVSPFILFPHPRHLNEPETLYSNRFRLENVPEALYRFEGDHEPVKEIVDQAHLSWIFRRTGKCSFVSFTAPFPDVAQSLSIKEAGGVAWRHIDSVYQLPTRAIIVELLRKCVNFELRARGLAFCAASKALYFPSGLLPADKIAYTTVNGKKRHVKVVGRKKFQRQPEPIFYRYHLSPVFAPIIDEQGNVFLIVKPRVRITEDNGNVFGSGVKAMQDASIYVRHGGIESGSHGRLPLQPICAVKRARALAWGLGSPLP